MKGIGGHQKTTAQSHDWLTPRPILDALGSFDLDPCATAGQPWATAKTHYTWPEQDGLMLPWAGRVWLNPPYGAQAARFLERMAIHRNGIALMFARTETDMFSQHVWPFAHGLLFLRGRLTFLRPDGSEPARRQGSNTAGGPSVLIAYDEESDTILRRCRLSGAYVQPVER
jgi:hypothetical protein